MKTDLYQGCLQWFDQLGFRQRVLVVLAILSTVYLIWYLLLGRPLEQHLKQAILEQSYLLSQQDNYKNTTLQHYKIDKALDMTEMTARVNHLKNELSILNSDISRYLSIIKSSDDVLSILSNLLVDSDGVKVIEVSVLPSEKIDLYQFLNINQDYVKNDDVDSNIKMMVVKHSVKLQLEGRYLSLLTYLKIMESLDETIFLEEIQYQLVKHPMSLISIQFYALSLSESDDSV